MVASLPADQEIDQAIERLQRKCKQSLTILTGATSTKNHHGKG